MSEYQIAGRPALEGVGRRAWDDAWACLRRPVPWVVNVFMAGLAVYLAMRLIDNATAFIVAPIVAFLAGLGLMLVGSVCRAPFKQRSEARSEAVRLLKLREPKLTVSVVPGRPLYDYSSESQARDLIYSFGIRVKNESDNMIKNCFATLLNIDARTKYFPLETEDGVVTKWCDDYFDLGLVSRDIPRHLIWPSNGNSSHLAPRDVAVIDVFYYIIGDERPLLLRTTTSRETNALEDEATLFVISLGSEVGLPNYCVCEYVPNAWSTENWSLKYIGQDHPDLKDYQLFEQIEDETA